jgi:hypothetical protein
VRLWAVVEAGDRLVRFLTDENATQRSCWRGRGGQEFRRYSGRGRRQAPGDRASRASSGARRPHSHPRTEGSRGCCSGAAHAEPWRAGRTGNLPFPPVRWDWRMLTACLDCGEPCQRSRCERDGGNRRALTTRCGYGHQRQQRRAALLPAAINSDCPLCGLMMTANQQLDLDHSMSAVLGGVGDRITHARCNRGRRFVTQEVRSPESRRVSRQAPRRQTRAPLT